MANWTKETAITEIYRLILEVENLKQSYYGSDSHTRWIFRSLEIFEEVFGENSRYYLSFAVIEWSYRGTFFAYHFDIEREKQKRHKQTFLEGLMTAKGIFEAAVDKIQRTSDISVLYEGKNTSPESSTLFKVLGLVEKSLRKVIRKVPKNELEVQDAFEGLLIGADVPFSRETDSIEYSSKTYTPDFTIKKADIAIELKICNRDGKEKEIIAQINDDILAYKKEYGNLLFVIYDTGFIRDIDKFSESFEMHKDVLVRVVKH